MKQALIISMLTIYSTITFAQVSVDMAKTQKIKKNGVEITTYEGKPFTGYLTETYENGKPKTWLTLKEGIANGLWQEWFENGKLRYNAYWKDGKGNGLWQYFYSNGYLKYEESYIMDTPNGISRSYHENGKLKEDNFWLLGKKQGVWTSYTETGTLVKTALYEEDKLIPTPKN